MRFGRWVLGIVVVAAAGSGSAQVLSPQGLEEAALMETGAERPPWRGRDWYMLSPEKRGDQRQENLRAAVKRLLEHNERVERLYRMERFLYHLAKGQPERSAEFLEKVDDRVVEYGFWGWLEAMIEMDRLTQIDDLIERCTGDEKEWRQDTFLDCLIEKHPAEARRRAERGLTPEWADRWIALHIREEEGEEAAVEWFMDRAPENKISRERAERIGQVAEHLILVNSEQIKWVEEMERRGEDTSFAYGVLAKRAAKDGKMKDAYRFLEKTREFIRKEVTEAVLREEMEEVTLMAPREGLLYRFGVHLPKPGARGRVEKAGLSDAFERLLRRRNVDSWTFIVKWLDQSHAELEAVLEEVREAVSSEEEQE